MVAWYVKTEDLQFWLRIVEGTALVTEVVGILKVMHPFLTKALDGDVWLASRSWFFVRREMPAVYRLLEAG
jgi:hypothetical protein